MCNCNVYYEIIKVCFDLGMDAWESIGGDSKTVLATFKIAQ